MNDAGEVAGELDFASGEYHACVWVPVANTPPVAVALVNGQESVTVDEQRGCQKDRHAFKLCINSILLPFIVIMCCLKFFE